MMRTKHKITRWLALLAAVCLLSSGVLLAQESWGGTNGASAWQAGASSAKTSSSSPRGAVSGQTSSASFPRGAASSASLPLGASSGETSSWIAGHTNTKLGAAPGGVWTDGTALPAVAGRIEGKQLAAGAVTAKSPLPAGLSTTTGIARLKTANGMQGKLQSLRPANQSRLSLAQPGANGNSAPPKLGAERERTLASSGHGGTRGHGQINFKNAPRSTVGEKKQTGSTTKKKPSNSPFNNPANLGMPTEPTEPTMPTEPTDPTDLDKLPHD